MYNREIWAFVDSCTMRGECLDMFPLQNSLCIVNLSDFQVEIEYISWEHRDEMYILEPYIDKVLIDGTPK